jgi:transposase InsO family protein
MSTWADFLRSQADALPACDFLETVTLSGARMEVFAVIERAGRRARFLIRDRDREFPALFGTVLNDAGIEVVLSGVRMPRMNSITERRVQTCRRELLDRTLIWNQRHLLHALREFEDFSNSHRPHQGIVNARPLHPLLMPVTNLEQITHLDIRRRQ